ncbi:cold-shock protein [Francisella frigiditurris]
MMSKLQGTVKFFNNQKGFGFISPSNGGKDVFIHISKLDKVGGTLSEGQKVSFETKEGMKGPEAINVEAL